jgi:hypothetical protein
VESSVGTMVEQVQATDADSGDNARLSYLIESGAYEHFDIDPKTGAIDVAAKLDFDRKPEYKIRVLAVDAGKLNEINISRKSDNLISVA